MQQYLLSVYQPDQGTLEPGALEGIMREVGAWESDLKAARAWVFTAGLTGVESATVVRARPGRAHHRRALRRGQGAHRRLHHRRAGRPGRSPELGAPAQRDHRAADRGTAGPVRGRPLTSVERVFREEHGRAVAVLARVLGDLDLAEEAVQDAFTTAVARWPREGVPPSPAGWIITTARNRAIDRLRRESGRAGRHAAGRPAAGRLRAGTGGPRAR